MDVRVIEDLWYSAENLRETARYCRFHNEELRDLSDEEVEQKLWYGIRAMVGSLTAENLRRVEGELTCAYLPAYLLIELRPPPTGSTLSASHRILFYVPLGRRPAIGPTG